MPPRGTDFYDGLNPVQEGLLLGTPAANLLTGLGLDEVFTRTGAAGLRALLPDALGSTLALADSSGAIQTEYTYEPFGATSVSGASSGNSFQYTGRENSIGLGRGDTNVCAFVSNAPTQLRDPLGLQAVVPIPGAPGAPLFPPVFWPGTPENDMIRDDLASLAEEARRG